MSYAPITKNGVGAGQSWRARSAIGEDLPPAPYPHHNGRSTMNDQERTNDGADDADLIISILEELEPDTDDDDPIGDIIVIITK